MQDRDNLLKKIAELEEKISRLEQDLVHDKLTSLKTRAFFEEKSKNYLDDSKKISEKRKNLPTFSDFSLIFFDIDHFKKINDTYGHLAGDEVLKSVAKIIESHVRAKDIVARWGGEEIAVLLLGADEKHAKIKADEIRVAIEDFKFEGKENVSVTVSAGVSSFDEGLDQKAILERADQALYRAKNDGRNQVVAYSQLGE